MRPTKNWNTSYLTPSLLPSFATGPDIVRVSAPVGSGRQYLYYRVLERDPKVDEVYNSQYSCRAADLVYDSETGNYTIKPKTSGYAFVFIIPQDVAKQRVDEIKELPAQLKNATDQSTIRRIPVTIANGLDVPYQLYTASDVASIGSKDYGLDKNYYLMNTIDMSDFINKNLALNPNWEWTPIGSINKPFSGSLTSMVYNGVSPTQSIVGWSLSRNLKTIEVGSTTDWRNFGIFGVVTGRISNINVYINNYIVNQEICQESALAEYNDYNYGLLVGKVTSRTYKGENDEDITQYGVIEDVLVYCQNLVYTYTHAPQNTTTKVNANFGVVGYLDFGSTIKNVDATLKANVASTDVIVNLGAVAGKNYGVICGDGALGQYDNVAEVNFRTNVVYDTAKTQKSSVGGIVGANFGAVMDARVLGTIYSQNSIVTTGGAVGYNAGLIGADSLVLPESGILSNILSSVNITTNSQVDAVQGGIVGESTRGELSNVYYDIYNQNNTNTGLDVRGISGGIAGIMRDSTLIFAIVQGYDISNQVCNLISRGGTFGGLVGQMIGGSVSRSFVDASMAASAGLIGGLIGAADIAATIENVYARGTLASGDAANKFALVGSAGGASISHAYAEFADDLVGVGGAITANNVWLIQDKPTSTTGDIKILNRTEALGFVTGDWIALGFDAALWAVDKSDNNPTNGGYAYLLDDTGAPFVRLVPKTIEVKANTFDTIVDNKINPVLNVAGDTQKLILAYQPGAVYALADLFSLKSTPEIDPSRISINIGLRGSNAQLLSSGNFMSAQIKILGTGTIYLKISSSQNPANAYDVVQICVVNAFDRFDITDSSGHSLFEPFGEDSDFVLKIKHNDSTQAYVSYYMGDERVDSVNGGLRFVTGLVRDDMGNLITARDADNNIITNYKISIYDWQTGVVGTNDCLYHDVASNDKIVLTATGDDRTREIITLILPYFNTQFYTLDADKNIVSLAGVEQYQISEYPEMNFATKLYYGVESIAMGAGDGTRVSAGDALESGVTIFNDAYTPDMTIDDLLWYQLYAVDSDGTETLVGYYDPTAAEGNESLISDYIFVTFSSLKYYATSNAVVIGYKVELSQAMRRALKTDQTYKIIIGAIDDNGQKLADKTASLKWTFIPQEVEHIEIEHFSDAVNSGSKLTQAGDTPTNTIVAGEYGLLRITISPEYSLFDSIEVTSSVVNGSPMVFDQRVLEERVDPVTKEVVYTYLTWQQGVGNIPNGLSLNRVSNVNGDFTGVFYVRTICLRTLPTGTQFTINVKITKNGEESNFARTLTVYQTDVLSLAGEHYSTSLERYIVAAGTGYTTADTLVQNTNPLSVSIGSAYYDSELTVDEASRAKGARVVYANGKYYLHTGSVAINNIITVTLAAKQNIGGFTYRATREISFEVVDFYISTLRTDSVISTTKRFAFIDGKTYPLRLFEGINNDNLNSVTAITFDTSNIETRRRVLTVLNQINGIGTDIYNGWSRRKVEPDGKIRLCGAGA